MSDLIDRQAAIFGLMKEATADGAYGYIDTKTACDVIKALPPAEADVITIRVDIDKEAWKQALASFPLTVLPAEKDGWIPVTERLPEDTQNIIVTRRDDGTTDFGQYNADKNWCVNDSYWPNAFDFVAWMPLPEPWKGEEE